MVPLSSAHRALWLFLHFSPVSSSALLMRLSWVSCNSLLFSPLFATGVPLLHTSFGLDSAGEFGRFTRLSGVQERMWTVSLEQWLRLGVGIACYFFFSLTTDKQKPVREISQSKTSAGPAEVTVWKGNLSPNLVLVYINLGQILHRTF